ncbi:MAG: porin [Pseudomonadota bacterium]
MMTGRCRAVTAAVALATAMPVVAADKELLDILLANGAIDQAQYEKLLKKEEIEKSDVDEVIATLDRKGLNVKTSDGDYTFKIGTRLHAEASTHKGDLPEGNEPNNGTELRRARIEAKGTIAKNWNWVAEVDFADDRTSVKDFWLGYKTEGGTKLMFGHQKQPYSLDIEMSSNDIAFVERSVDNFLLVPFADRAIGFRAERSGSNWYAAGGFFGDSAGPLADAQNEGRGAVGRFVYSPIVDDDQILHLGVRALGRDPADGARFVRLRDETTHLSGLRIVDTGVILGVDRSVVSGLEAAYAAGPLSFMGEYHDLEIERNNADDLNFSGWHLIGRWAITGESYADAYKMSSGEFKRLTPRQDFDRDAGTWGAWEFALRYANLDLNDGDILGGEEDVVSTALNWYPNSNMRFMFEWTRIVDTDESSPLREAAVGLNIFQVRTQYTF